MLSHFIYVERNDFVIFVIVVRFVQSVGRSDERSIGGRFARDCIAQRRQRRVKKAICFDKIWAKKCHTKSNVSAIVCNNSAALYISKATEAAETKTKITNTLRWKSTTHFSIESAERVHTHTHRAIRIWFERWHSLFLNRDRDCRCCCRNFFFYFYFVDVFAHSFLSSLRLC